MKSTSQFYYSRFCVVQILKIKLSLRRGNCSALPFSAQKPIDRYNVHQGTPISLVDLKRCIIIIPYAAPRVNARFSRIDAFVVTSFSV
jgi:hypothetical protein